MNDSLIGHILVRLVFGKACLPRVLGMLIKNLKKRQTKGNSGIYVPL
jgi:hypothetical protein